MSETPKPVIEWPEPIINSPRGAADDLCGQLEELQSVYRLLDEVIFDSWVASDRGGMATTVHSSIMVANRTFERLTTGLREAVTRMSEGASA